MEFMSAREAADKWGIPQRRVATLCANQRIKEATMAGNMLNLSIPIELFVMILIH